MGRLELGDLKESAYFATNPLPSNLLSVKGVDQTVSTQDYWGRERPPLRFIVASICFLWPGFNGIVRYGLWSQLAIALTFGALCQGTLALNFLWCDFLSQFVRVSLFAALFISWVALSVVASVRLRRYEKMRKADSKGQTFLEAQELYLKGNWFETECCLRALLKNNPYDADALLYLASLYRHTKRFSEAKRTISELERLDASFRWEYEIALEKKALKEEERLLREEKESSNQKTGNSEEDVFESPENQSVESVSSRAA